MSAGVEKYVVEVWVGSIYCEPLYGTENRAVVVVALVS